MAGFEVIVRPVVLPNIRPPSARVLPPVDDPEQGKVIVSGGGGKFMGTSVSSSISVSSQAPHREEKRQFDVERIYQVDEKGGGHGRSGAEVGNINKNNFIDVERVKKISLSSGSGDDKDIINRIYADPPKADNIETIQTDQTRRADQQ